MPIALAEGSLMVGNSTTVRPSAASAVALICAALTDHPLEDGRPRDRPPAVEQVAQHQFAQEDHRARS